MVLLSCEATDTSHQSGRGITPLSAKWAVGRLPGHSVLASGNLSFNNPSCNTEHDDSLLSSSADFVLS